MLDWMCLDNSHYCKGESFYKNQNSWGLQSPLILKTQHAFTTSIMNQHILMIQKDTSFLFLKKRFIQKWYCAMNWQCGMAHCAFSNSANDLCTKCVCRFPDYLQIWCTSKPYWILAWESLVPLDGDDFVLLSWCLFFNNWALV